MNILILKAGKKKRCKLLFAAVKVLFNPCSLFPLSYHHLLPQAPSIKSCGVRRNRARRADARMAAAISDADCRALDHAYADLICMLDHKPQDEQPEVQARIPAAERLAPLPALVELDLSSLAFHLEMEDDDDVACAFLSTDAGGRGCQERRSPQSTCMDSLFSQASTASSASSDSIASKIAIHPLTLSLDHRLDPDYCFDLCSPSSPHILLLGEQMFAGTTPFDCGSNPFTSDSVVFQGQTGNPLEDASKTTSHLCATLLDSDYRLDRGYCFDSRGPFSRRSPGPTFDKQTCAVAGETPFDYGSTPINYLGLHGREPLEQFR